MHSLQQGAGPVRLSARDCALISADSASCFPATLASARLAPAPLAATVTGNWNNSAPANAPAGRWSAFLAWDAADNYVVLYGGYSYAYGGYTDTWTYQNGNWTQLSPTNNPIGLVGLVYDAKDKYVLGLVSNFTANASYSWKFSAGAWSNITNGTQPTPRWRTMMTWDVKDRYVLMYGGCDTATCNAADVSNDTWKFVGGLWTRLNPTVPPPQRQRGGLAWDYVDQYAVLYGGYDNSGGELNDTYTFVGGQWTKRLPTTPPSARDGILMATLGPTHGVLLFGGEYGGLGSVQGTLSDTWEYVSGAWTSLSPTVSPGNRCCTGATFLPLNGSVLIFGGYQYPGNAQSDTWLYVTAFNLTANVSSLVGDIGASLQFNASGAGGIPPYRFNWTFGDGNRSSSANVTHSYSRAGTYRVWVWLNDSTNRSQVEGFTIVIHSLPTVSILPAHPLADAGFPVQFSAKITAGTAPFALHWTFGDGSGVNATAPSHTYATAGTYLMSVWLNDSDKNPAHANVSFAVNASPKASASVSSSTTDVGLIDSFTGSVANGSGTFVFVWIFGDGGRSTMSSATHAYAAGGTYLATFYANDTAGGSAHVSLSVRVNGAPTVAASALPGTTDVGLPVNFSAVAGSGTAPYSYAWLFGDGNGTAVPIAQHAYTVPGAYTAQLWVNDSVGGVVYRPFGVQIAPDPVVSVIATPTLTVTGQSVGFTASVTMGLSPYWFQWLFGDGAQAAGGSPTLGHAFTVAGTYTVKVTVNDSAGFTTTASVRVTVVAPLSASSSAAPARLTVGQSLTVTVAATQGAPPLSYVWLALPTGCPAPTGPVLTCTPSVGGSYQVTVVVSDAAGESITTRAPVFVDPALSVLGYYTNSSSACGSAVANFSAHVSGGRPAYAVSWSFGDGSADSSIISPSHNYSRSGTYAAALTVTDANGYSRVSNVPVTVATGSCTSPTPAGSLTGVPWVWVGVGVATAATALLGTAFVLRRRSRGEPPAAADEPVPSDESLSEAPASDESAPENL